MDALLLWQRNRWLCWGVGPVVAAWAGTFPTIGLLELARVRGWLPRAAAIEYAKDKGQSRDEVVKAMHTKVTFRQQLHGAICTMLGPNVFLNGLLSAVLMPLRIKLSASDPLPSIKEFSITFAIMYVIGDLGLYWGHRIQHEIDFLWKRCHSVHHSVDAPTPMTTLYIDSTDATLQAGLPIILAAFAVQPHPVTFYAYVAARTAENVLNHCGTDYWLINWLTLKILPFRAGIDHHDYHHKFSGHAGIVKNLGESFWIWDWMFGTLANTSKVRR